MKNILLFGLALLVLIALFGDGGLEVSPTVSPRLEFKPNVSYGTETTYTTEIGSQTNIETNIEHQTVIIQPAPAISGGGGDGGHGVTLLDPVAGVGCVGLYPGEQIYNGPDLQGACFVQNEAGQKFFINRNGVRWLLEDKSPQAAPLQPQGADLTLEQLQAAFLRNGGKLPILWDFQTTGMQIEWLKEQAETWK